MSIASAGKLVEQRKSLSRRLATSRAGFLGGMKSQRVIENPLEAYRCAASDKSRRLWTMTLTGFRRCSRRSMLGDANR